jgi:hypothetical protein
MKDNELRELFASLEHKIDERFAPAARTDAQNIELHKHLERIDQALKDRVPPPFELPSSRIPMIISTFVGVLIFGLGMFIGTFLK